MSNARWESKKKAKSDQVTELDHPKADSAFHIIYILNFKDYDIKCGVHFAILQKELQLLISLTL